MVYKNGVGMVGTLLSMLKTSCAEGLSADGNQCKLPSSNVNSTNLELIQGVSIGVVLIICAVTLLYLLKKNSAAAKKLVISFLGKQDCMFYCMSYVIGHPRHADHCR